MTLDRTPIGEGKYDRMRGLEIIHDFAIIRGDIDEPYAHVQLAEVIDRRVKFETQHLMTDDEHHAMELTVSLWNYLCAIAGEEEPRGTDLRELCAHIHAIQRAIMAQAACRAFPDKYRLLGDLPGRKDSDD